MLKIASGIVLIIVSTSQPLFLQDKEALRTVPVRKIAMEAFRDVTGEVKTMNDPYLRLNLSLLLVRFMAKNDSLRAGREEIIKGLVTDGISDLSKSKEKFPDGMYRFLRREYESLAKEHSVEFKPEMSSEKEKETASEKNATNDLDIALSMLRSGRAEAATELVIRYLGNPESREEKFKLLMFADTLQGIAPQQTAELLTKVLGSGGRNLPVVGTGTLLSLKGLYTGPQVSVDMRRSYVSLLLALIENDFAGKNQPVGTGNEAYVILNGMMPLIQRIGPDLYDRAHYVLQLVGNVASKEIQDDISLDERVRSSTDPVELLLNEAKLSRTAERKQELVARAAQLARDKGKVEQAIDIISSDDNPPTKWSLSFREEFLSEITSRAIGDENFELARRSLSKMKRMNTRIALLQRLAIKLHNTGRVSEAIEVMDEASTLVEKIDDRFEKAEGRHSLVRGYQIVDKARAYQATQMAVKATNFVDVKALGEGDRSTPDRTGNLQKLYRLSMAVMQTGRIGAAIEPLLTFSNVRDVESQDLRLYAKFGASQEILKN
jgi:hypothetical protein